MRFSLSVTAIAGIVLHFVVLPVIADPAVEAGAGRAGHAASSDADRESSAQYKYDEQSPALVSNRGADRDGWWQALPRPEWAGYERIDVDHGWFEVYRVVDGVFAIYEPGQFEEVISYLMVGQERALLFDTGLGVGDMRRLVSELTDLEVIVLNSHSHYDHVGGNHAFDAVLGVDTAFSRRNERGRARSEVAEFIGPGWIWKALPQGFDPADYSGRPYTVSKRVADGDVLDLGGRVLEILFTPGHAPDALCLIDRTNRLLFTGDTFYLAPLYTHLDGSDFDAYRQTASRLAALTEHVDHLLTGHNVPVVPARHLAELEAAFEAIVVGQADYAMTDGNREYDFGDFSVIVSDSEFQ